MHSYDTHTHTHSHAFIRHKYIHTYMHTCIHTHIHTHTTVFPARNQPQPDTYADEDDGTKRAESVKVEQQSDEAR